MKFSTFPLSVALITLSVSSAIKAQETNTTVKVITFQGGWNLPVWVAQEKGFFNGKGLTVEMDYTPNSSQLVKDLMAGKYNIAVAGIDNVIAYQEGQVKEPLSNPDMFAFYGVDNGLLSLVANPKINSVVDLKGKQVSVDALTTGYAFVIKNYLEKNGVTEGNVQYKSIGSTNDRFNALIEGKTDATLLRTPLNLQAKEKGFKVLASGIELGDYQGTTGITTRSWANQNGETLVNYIGGYIDGLNWIYDPKNQKEAEDILVKRTPGMTATLAHEALQELLNNGLQRDAAINAEGVKNVLLLRSKLAEPKKDLNDAQKYYDVKYYQKAVAISNQ